MATFSPWVERILAVNGAAYQELCPKSGPSPAARELLQGISLETLFTRPIVSPVAAYATLAGLWLWHDGLAECHALVQQSPAELKAAYQARYGCGKETTPNTESTLAYWHALMHRREGDFENAKYWFRRVGNHPVFPALYSAASTFAKDEKFACALANCLRQGAWNASAFVDLCAAAERGQVALVSSARRVATAEWKLLFEFCHEAATAENGTPSAL